MSSGSWQRNAPAAARGGPRSLPTPHERLRCRGSGASSEEEEEEEASGRQLPASCRQLPAVCRQLSAVCCRLPDPYGAALKRPPPVPRFGWYNGGVSEWVPDPPGCFDTSRSAKTTRTFFQDYTTCPFSKVPVPF